LAADLPGCAEAIANFGTPWVLVMRIDDWDDFRARVDRQPYPIAIERVDAALKFLYLDARKFLGHYLEYVWMTDERWAQVGGR